MAGHAIERHRFVRREARGDTIETMSARLGPPQDESDAGSEPGAPDQGTVAPRTLGQLTGQMAHDLNNMLAVTLSTVEIASRIDDLPKVRGFLETALKTIELQRAFIENMARCSTACESPSLVDVQKVAVSVLDEIKAGIAAPVAPTLRLEAKRSLAHCDEGFLRDAIRHVVRRALIAAGGRGQSLIVVRNASASDSRATSGRELVLVEVVDTGDGMPQDACRKAFDLFAGNDATDLGLAQARDAMRRAGGFANIDSERGVGTTVTLGLPLAS